MTDASEDVCIAESYSFAAVRLPGNVLSVYATLRRRVCEVECKRRAAALQLQIFVRCRN